MHGLQQKLFLVSQLLIALCSHFPLLAETIPCLQISGSRFGATDSVFLGFVRAIRRGPDLLHVSSNK